MLFLVMSIRLAMRVSVNTFLQAGSLNVPILSLDVKSINILTENNCGFWANGNLHTPFGTNPVSSSSSRYYKSMRNIYERLYSKIIHFP